MRHSAYTLAALVALAVTFAGSASAHHAWSPYHWARTMNPFTVCYDNQAPNYSSYLARAAGEWSSSPVLDVAFAQGCQRQVLVQEGYYGTTGWLGLTTLNLDATATPHTASGTIQLNDTYLGSGGQYGTDAWRTYVTCHEMGHTLGLNHQNDEYTSPNLGTCLDLTNYPGGVRKGKRQVQQSDLQPNQGDYDELRCIYDPATYGTTLSTATHSCISGGHLDDHDTGAVAPMAATITLPALLPVGR